MESVQQEPEQEQTPGASVHQLQQPSDTDVQDAAAALNDTGQVWDDAADGRDPERNAKDEDDDEELEATQIESDNLPAVPKPSDETNKLIMDAKEQMDEINAKRAQLNADASVIREQLKAKGIDTATFEYACKVMDLDEDKRQRIDNTYILVRNAGCKPLQNDMFMEETKH